METHYGYAISGSVQRSAGFNGEAGIGYSFGAIRTELTYAYTSNSLVSSQASAMGISEKTKGLSGYTTTNAFLGSAYWDFTNQSRFTPYLGGGFGYGLIYQSPATFQMGYGGSVGPSAYISVPAYQGKAGVSYRCSHACLSLSRRYGPLSGREIQGMSMASDHPCQGCPVSTT